MSNSKTGNMYIKPNKLAYKILQWMQQHEGTNKLKHTTGHKLAEEIVNLPDVDTGEITIEQTISKMIRCNVIYRDKEERSLFADFRINYWHKSIPADILDNAPASVKRAMAKTIGGMSDNQYMDDEGCVVTPNAVEKCEDPFNEGVECIEAKFPEMKPVTVTDTAPQFEEPTTQEVNVPLEIKKDGKQITVNLSLTINL